MVCFQRFKDGVGASVADPRLHRNVFFDLANEHNSGNTSLNQGKLRELADVVHGEDLTRVVTVSATGSVGTQGGLFDSFLSDDTIDFASPHFSRTRDWSVETGNRINDLRDLIVPGSPIHLQEDSRRGSTCTENEGTVAWCCGKADANPPPPGDESDCEEDDFLTALALAAQEGAAGWVLHTDAGFKLDEAGVNSFWGELDAVEKDVMDAMAATLGEFRCLPPPVYSDDFNDAANDTNLRGRSLQVGSALWDVEANGKLETENQKVTTKSPNGTPVASVPFHLPTGFDGTASVEAELTNTNGNATSISIGFSTDAVLSLDQFGTYWVSLGEDGNIHVYGQGPVELATINFVAPVTQAKVKLEYQGGVNPKLTLFSEESSVIGSGGWYEMVSVFVDEQAIEFAVLEIDRGVNLGSFVDDFAARLTP